jgi:predicted phosphodiesterase
MKPSHKTQIADDLLSRFPKAPTLTLSRMAYKANPSVWTNLESVRRYFRTRRGAGGARQRRESTDKSHFRTLQKPGDPFGRLPKPLRDIDDWGSVDFNGPLRALVISDVHIPFYDKPSTICALKYGQDLRADLVLLNGDIADHHAESDYIKDPRRRDFPGEVRAVKDFLRVVRDLFPKARIVYKLGNHEERHIRYMRVKAPELLGLPEFEIESVFGLADNDIQLVKDNRPIKLGGLYVLHGHEYRFAISNPVNPARGLFLRAKTNAICGHFHQTSQHSERSLDQKVRSTWSIGFLGDLHPEYRPINNWNHGFMIVQVDKNDAFEVGNLRIVNGKAYY